MELFAGTFFETLSSDGRVLIPMPFRHSLGGDGRLVIFLSSSPVEAALDCFGERLYQHLSRSHRKDDAALADEDKTLKLLEQTKRLEIDESGCVTLPRQLIVHAGLVDDVAFVGLGKKFQIMTPAHYRAVQSRRLHGV